MKIHFFPLFLFFLLLISLPNNYRHLDDFPEFSRRAFMCFPVADVIHVQSLFVFSCEHRKRIPTHVFIWQLCSYEPFSVACNAHFNAYIEDFHFILSFSLTNDLETTPRCTENFKGDMVMEIYFFWNYFLSFPLFVFYIFTTQSFSFSLEELKAIFPNALKPEQKGKNRPKLKLQSKRINQIIMDARSNEK